MNLTKSLKLIEEKHTLRQKLGQDFWKQSSIAQKITPKLTDRIVTIYKAPTQ